MILSFINQLSILNNAATLLVDKYPL